MGWNKTKITQNEKKRSSFFCATAPKKNLLHKMRFTKELQALSFEVSHLPKNEKINQKPTSLWDATQKWLELWFTYTLDSIEFDTSIPSYRYLPIDALSTLEYDVRQHLIRLDMTRYIDIQTYLDPIRPDSTDQHPIGWGVISVHQSEKGSFPPRIWHGFAERSRPICSSNMPTR